MKRGFLLASFITGRIICCNIFIITINFGLCSENFGKTYKFTSPRTFAKIEQRNVFPYKNYLRDYIQRSAHHALPSLFSWAKKIFFLHKIRTKKQQKMTYKRGRAAKKWCPKLVYVLFSVSKFSLLGFSWGSDGITAKSKKNTWKSLLVYLR